MKKTLATVVLMLASSALWADGGDLSKVNGSIQVESGRQVGSVATVNGSIELGDSVTAGNIEATSGSIKIGGDCTVGMVNARNGGAMLGHGSKARSIKLVNGGLQLDQQTHVTGYVISMNGAVKLDRGAQIGGHLENVNGKLELDAARIGKGITTTNGDIEIGAGSHVDGGILVKKPEHSMFPSQRAPRVTIGLGAVVNGTLKFEREVELRIASSAKVGEVVGATPIRE